MNLNWMVVPASCAAQYSSSSFDYLLLLKIKSTSFKFVYYVGPNAAWRVKITELAIGGANNTTCCHFLRARLVGDVPYVGVTSMF